MALTESQAEVYDRQIRVWGVEVQKRLSSAKVLIAGMGGLAAEVAKNLVLAGVGNVTLMDDQICGQRCAGCFLVPHDSPPDKTVAEVAAASLQEMNPLVSISHVSSSIAKAEGKEVVAGYEVVVLLGYPGHIQDRVGGWCREAGVQLYCAACRGPAGYFLADLQTHTFHEKVQQSGTGTRNSATRTWRYPSVQQSIAEMSEPLPPHHHPLLPALAACWSCEMSSCRAAAAPDLPGLLREVAARCDARSGDASASCTLVQQYICGPADWGPCIAVLGGVLANDVVRATSRTGACARNLFLYSAASGRGQFQDLGVVQEPVVTA